MVNAQLRRNYLHIEPRIPIWSRAIPNELLHVWSG